MMMSMHENMHERASQQDQPYPVIADMRRMVLDQNKERDQENSRASHAKWRFPP